MENQADADADLQSGKSIDITRAGTKANAEKCEKASPGKTPVPARKHGQKRMQQKPKCKYNLASNCWVISEIRMISFVPLCNIRQKRRRESTDVIESDADTERSGHCERVPRRRMSATWDQRMQMEKARSTASNLVDPMQVKIFRSWDDFHTSLELYCSSQHLRFRIRDSETTAKYNSKNSEKVPTLFEWTHKIYRCKADEVVKTSAIAENKELMDVVTVLANANASTRNITQYVSENLVHPQQVRNLLRRMHGGATAEDRFKTMIESFVRSDGNEILLVQDQMDITCAVVMQTAAQKQVFEHWGQSLSMDWTHGTNNLGYHLVATSATGRGVPVLDFIALNETADIMRQILEFFKAKNGGWRQVKSFVIDKDFVEWRVLEERFPGAKVLLCQFHTLTYWKKLLQKPKYNLKVKQRDDIEEVITQMIYSTTESAFVRSCIGLTKYCSAQKCEDVLNYFNKNWKSCYSMWSNFARSAYFSAGNTTTNRVESNWNQLKMLLGKNTTLDNTIAGVLAHQVTVLRQVGTALRRHQIRSRMPDTVPDFLRRVSGRLSDFALEKVQEQWDTCGEIAKVTSCIQDETQSWKWEVRVFGRLSHCDDLTWTCSCLFYSSYLLPCQHLMHLAHKVHRFVALPEAAIPTRWCMRSACDVSAAIETTVATLLPTIALTNLKQSARFCHDDSIRQDDKATQDGVPSFASRLAKRRKASGVVFVRLRRKERANLVVLSSNEKHAFAKAVFEPLIERLSQLSSLNFYKQLKVWEDVVADAMQSEHDMEAEHKAETGDATSANGTTDSDPDSDIIMDPVDAMETFNLMNELEAEPSNDYDEYSEGSHVDLPVASGNTDSLNFSGEVEDHSTTMTKDVCAAPHICAIETVDTAVSRSVDVIQLPPAKRQPHTRQASKQGWKKQGRRKALFCFPTDLTVSLPEVVQWALHTKYIKNVKNILDKYPVVMDEQYLKTRKAKSTRMAIDPAEYVFNFVVPPALMKRMLSAVEEEKSRRKPSAYFISRRNEDVVSGDDKEIVVSVDPDLVSFSSRWVADMRWLCEDWDKLDVPDVPELYSLELDSHFSNLDAPRKLSDCQKLQQIALEVMSRYECSAMRTRFSLKSRNFGINFEEIIGFVACESMLNDSVVQFACQAICDSTEDCYFVNSLVFSTGRSLKPPTRKISTTEYVILPVHLSDIHWGVLIVNLVYPSRISVHFYEPLCRTSYRPVMQDHWHEYLEPFLKEWHVASGEITAFPDVTEEWILQPKQSDGSSCGVMIIGQVYSLVHDEYRFQRQVPSATYKIQ
ncbi:hypothetical protein FI667_g6596, partial [Globisporangium splendens]